MKYLLVGTSAFCGDQQLVFGVFDTFEEAKEAWDCCQGEVMHGGYMWDVWVCREDQIN